MRKWTLLLFMAAACLLIGAASADDKHGCMNAKCDCPAPCECPAPCHCGDTACYNDECCDDECCRFLVYGDWLYWNTRKADLDYAIPYENASSDSNNIGRIHHICPDYSSGYRLGFFRDCCDSFYGLRITHFDDKLVNKQVESTGDMAATRPADGDGINDLPNGQVEFAKARYKVNLDVIELESGMKKQFDCDGELNFFGGFRLAFLNQHMHSSYSASEDDPDGLNISAVKVRQKVDMDGYGLYVGGGVEKPFCRGVGLFGNLSLGLMVGHFERKMSQKSHLSTDPFELVVNLRDQCYRLVTNVDMAVGLQYGFCGLCCTPWYIRLGYEFHSWMNTSDFISLFQDDQRDFQTLDRHADNIGFDGLFLRLQGEF